MKKIRYLQIGLSILTICIIFIIISWITCEPCELKIMPSIACFLFVVLSFVFIAFGLLKEEESVEMQDEETTQ